MLLRERLGSLEVSKYRCENAQLIDQIFKLDFLAQLSIGGGQVSAGSANRCSLEIDMCDPLVDD